ncbi:glycosyltransferase family 4 protein [uncultured Dokdonia sp.]|uniref:glycosyltransferase family 4 protein n=1 Tax=uncultured Dokdonia sp. TaxID=575653 RepID=UPI0030EF3111|tara:strand:- start:146935 stop:148086 length:1152 start_codon:yes stop_codon:yes gene_type:complete
MHIVQIHNRYKDIGGEDIVVSREKLILEAAGHKVSQYIVNNNNINTLSRKLKTALSLPYSVSQKKLIKTFLKETLPDVVHVHNFLPIITPSVFYACKELYIPVVVTLHNYRILCSNGLLFRDGKPCEDCITSKWGIPAIKHGCYQESKVATVFPVLSNALHGYLLTWSSYIDKVILLSEFSKNIFKKSHITFREQQVVIKPNFTEDRGYLYDKENYILFVGRLSDEKGIVNVIEACIKANKRLKIAGTGPLYEVVENYSHIHNNIEFVGNQDGEELSSLYKNAQALITASKMYETFGLVIIESFSFGTPVIAPSFGNAGQLVEHEGNGLHYTLDNVDDLAKAILKLDYQDQETMRKNARNTFLKNYTAQDNVSKLEEIYQSVL